MQIEHVTYFVGETDLNFGLRRNFLLFIKAHLIVEYTISTLHVQFSDVHQIMVRCKGFTVLSLCLDYFEGMAGVGGVNNLNPFSRSTKSVLLVQSKFTSRCVH